MNKERFIRGAAHAVENEMKDGYILPQNAVKKVLQKVLAGIVLISQKDFQEYVKLPKPGQITHVPVPEPPKRIQQCFIVPDTKAHKELLEKHLARAKPGQFVFLSDEERELLRDIEIWPKHTV